MNLGVINVTALQDIGIKTTIGSKPKKTVSEYHQTGELAKILMNVMKNLHAEEGISIVTIHVGATNVPMWDVHKDMKRKTHIAIDAREPHEDADRQTLSVSRNQFQYLLILCHLFPIFRLEAMELICSPCRVQG